MKHQFMVPYTSQQNGVAERKNRSLVESAKSMLLDADLDNRFWGEAILTTTYLQNRIASKNINKTPLELFTGRKPDLSHIKIFGSKAFTLVPKEKRKKFDDKAEVGILIGYHGDTAGYRILNPATNKVWISRAVKIIENNQKGQESSFETKKREVTQIQSIKTKLPVTPSTQHVELEESEDQESEGATDNENDEEFQMSPQVPQKRVSQHSIKGVPPLRLIYKVKTDYIKEKDWKEMMQMTPREKLWHAAAEEENESLNNHQVWKLTDFPPGRKAITYKWIFKGKTDSEGNVHTYKARLVARGFSQRYGEDYDETFAPVVRHETIRVLLVIAAQRRLHVRHLDVKSAYLNGELNEEIFMEQPEGFVKPDSENKVLKLKKSLYGLKQSARVWNKRATEILVEIGFINGKADQCLYSRQEKNGSTTYILLYVDDLLVAGESEEITKRVTKQIEKYFEIKDFGNVNHYLGIKIERESDGSFLLDQRAKIVKLLDDHGLLEPKPVATPMKPEFLSASQELDNNNVYKKVMGSLLYIATVSRPDIATSVGLLCRRVEKATNNDWNAEKRVMRYLASTLDRKLRLTSGGDIRLTCYVDADWANDKTDRKSTSGHVFLLGDGVIAWSSRKQTSVAMSSTEAEYIAALFASRALLWLRQLFTDMNISVKEPTVMFEDNQGCITLISGRSGARSKHIDVCYHHIQDLQNKKIIDVRYCPSDQTLADIFTKPLAREKFKFFIERLGFSEI